MFLLNFLQKKYGISRRNFTHLVDESKVLLNKKIVDSYKVEVKSGDQLKISGGKLIDIDIKIIVDDVVEESVFYVFNKPKGFVVSKSDKFNKTIYDILPDFFKKYYYIGRLDKDSHGLLLLTNDSVLVDSYQHPRNQIEKEYLVQINKDLSIGDMDKIKKGVKESEEWLRVKNIEYMEKKTKLKIVLVEGKNRHIRRMFEVLGYRVLDLQRIREANICLGDLKFGEYRSVKNNGFF